MPNTPYLEVNIGGQNAEVNTADFPLAISYKLESSEDFQTKTSSNAFNVKLPATLQNQKIANSYHNPSVSDNTPGQVKRSHQPAFIVAGGDTLLTGKAFLENAVHGDQPKEYQFNFYGNAGDWIVDLKEATLFDFLKHINFTFSKSYIQSTWAYDGTNQSLPLVFAPMRFRGFMDIDGRTDTNVDPTYLRPSISVYWLIYWAFKSLGYRIDSTFLDTAYFRRMAMPWTWGNFLDSDGTKIEVHKFLAKSTEDSWVEDFTGDTDMKVTNDTTDGAFDNNNEYSQVSKRSTWEYKTPDFGVLDATFSAQIQYNCTLVGSNSYCKFYLRWYHYDASAGTTTMFKQQTVIQASGHNLGREDVVGVDTFFATQTVALGDKIMCAYYHDIHAGKGVGARANNLCEVLAFQLEYFRIPLGGTINFENFIGLKKHKFLDFFGGVCDLFDLSFNTDSVSKVISIEPTHPYSLTNSFSTKTGGYFNGNTIDWTNKKDLKEWKLDLYSNNEKGMIFRFKQDENDGILKILNDRNLNIMAAGKYVFPDRFKAGIKEFTNRFFAPATHYDVPQFKAITGIAPQFMCIIPENISNTSNLESSNTFLPKIAYYKGEVSGVGGWKYDGNNRTTLPYIFAVNYKPGGENDPILSYSDERIGANIGKGLLKRFFWQRLAIMRNGQFYDAARFHLNNNDVKRPGHREFKVVDGNMYELIEISKYAPLNDDSTECVMRRWVPISQEDADNTFPSATALALPVQPLTGEDIKYAPLICLTSDIPTE